MRSWKKLSLLSCAMLACAGLALSNDTVGDPGTITPGLRGPCRRAVQGIPVVPGCEPTCNLWCTDPCKAVVVAPGKCMGVEGPCSVFTDTFTAEMCRECTCPFGGGACIDEGIYSSGTQNKQNCVDAA